MCECDVECFHDVGHDDKSAKTVAFQAGKTLAFGCVSGIWGHFLLNGVLHGLRKAHRKRIVFGLLDEPAK